MGRSKVYADQAARQAAYRRRRAARAVLGVEATEAGWRSAIDEAVARVAEAARTVERVAGLLEAVATVTPRAEYKRRVVDHRRF